MAAQLFGILRAKFQIKTQIDAKHIDYQFRYGFDGAIESQKIALIQLEI